MLFMQMLLEQKHDQVADLKQERQKEEQELSDVRNLYKDSQTVVNKERKKGSCRLHFASKVFEIMLQNTQTK